MAKRILIIAGMAVLVVCGWMGQTRADCKSFSVGSDVNQCVQSCQRAGCEITYSGGHSWCLPWCEGHHYGGTPMDKSSKVKVNNLVSRPNVKPTEDIHY